MEDAAKNFEQINIMGTADVKKLTLTMVTEAMATARIT